MKALRLMLGISVLAMPLFAQSSQPTHLNTTVKATTRAVVLDVVVRDKNGRPVHGLTKADFTLLEENQPQTISSLDESSDQQFSSSQNFTAGAQEIILLDEMNTRFADVAYVRHCLEKLLSANGGNLRQSTALLALTNDGLRILHDATNDGRVLLATLDTHRTALPWRQHGGVYGEMERIDLSIGALHEIAMASVGSNVRKNVIWISPGFPLTSSMTFSDQTQEHIFEAIRILSDELLRARIAVYTIDPRVIPSSMQPADASEEGFSRQVKLFSEHRTLDFQDVALPRFANETGGRSYWGRNDIDTEVAESATESESYYTISYYPTNRKFDGKFRNIQVQVNRPNLDVRTRAGYFAMPEPAPLTEKEADYQLERALSNPLHFIAIPVKAEIRRSAKNARFAELHLEVDRRALTWTTADNGDLQYDILAGTAIFNDKGKITSGKAHAFSGTVDRETAANTAKKTIVLELSTPISPSTKKMRIVVRDVRSGEMGSAEVELP